MRPAQLARLRNTAVAVILMASVTSVATPASAAGDEAAGPHVYVANLGSDSVSVIDADTDAVVATIPLEQGSRPQGLALTPDGAKLYVTHENRDYVSVIDTATNTPATTITVGDSPRGIGISPDGTRAFVANTFGLSVSVIDVGTDTIVTTVPLGTLPLRLAVNPNGNFVYTTNATNNTVSVIGADSLSVVATIPVSSSPVGIAVSPDGDTVYVTHEGAFGLTVIDANTNTVATTVPLGALSRGVAVSGDGSRVYASALTGAPRLFVIDTSSNTVMATIPLPDYFPTNVAFGGGRVYVVHDQSPGMVSVIDATTNAVIDSILVGSFPAGVVVETIVENQLPVGTHDGFEGEAGPFRCAAAGWAVDPDDRYADLNIRILADSVPVAFGVANRFRQDLLDAGESPDGLSGFYVRLWGLVSFNEPHLITAQAQDAQTAEWVNLNLTPKELTCVASTSESPNPKTAFFTADCTFGGPVLVESVFFADDNPDGGSTSAFDVIGENTTFIVYTPGTDMNADGVCLFGWTGGWEPKPPWNGTFQANVFVTPKN